MNSQYSKGIHLKLFVFLYVIGACAVPIVWLNLFSDHTHTQAIGVSLILFIFFAVGANFLEYIKRNKAHLTTVSLELERYRAIERFEKLIEVEKEKDRRSSFDPSDTSDLDELSEFAEMLEREG